MGGVGTGTVGVTTTGNATGATATLNNVNTILNIFIKNLQDILDNFKVGAFNEMSADAAINVMDKASILITKETRNRSTAYDKARTLGKIFQELVSGWKQTVQLNNTMADALINLGILEGKLDEQTIILNDRDLLLDYLHQRTKQYGILPQLQVSSISAAFKAEYNVYIRLWGYPPNGVWDVEKLSNIILDLQLGHIDENGNRQSGYTKPVNG
jgi:hypothetical protein